MGCKRRISPNFVPVIETLSVNWSDNVLIEIIYGALTSSTDLSGRVLLIHHECVLIAKCLRYYSTSNDEVFLWTVCISDRMYRTFLSIWDPWLDPLRKPFWNYQTEQTIEYNGPESKRKRKYESTQSCWAVSENGSVITWNQRTITIQRIAWTTICESHTIDNIEFFNVKRIESDAFEKFGENSEKARESSDKEKYSSVRSCVFIFSFSAVDTGNIDLRNSCTNKGIFGALRVKS